MENGKAKDPLQPLSMPAKPPAFKIFFINSGFYGTFSFLSTSYCRERGKIPPESSIFYKSITK